MEREIWRRIDGHEQYLVSNLGNVYSMKSKRLLVQRKNSMGYLRVQIDGKAMLVHRLVAKTFVPGEDEMVNHLDFDPLNNRADNLEWTNRAGNMRYSAERGRFAHNESWNGKIRASLIKRMGRPVRCYFSDETFKDYCTVNATREDGFLPGQVSRCCNGLGKTHRGLRWEFI